MKPNRKLKKPQSSCSKLALEEIIGLTVKNGNGLASSMSDSKSVYVAGCVVVVYDVESGIQSHLMASNRSPKPLSCVAVSRDGSHIAAGESGHQSAILLWNSATLTSVLEMKGHRYGVVCMAFSPDGKHLVSVGFPPDGYLCLWDWRSGILVTKMKACSSFSAVSSVDFSSDASFIITAGKRHLKIWTVGLPTKTRAKNEAVSLAMHGKPVTLGNHKGSTFIAITSPFKTNRNLVDGKSGELVPVYALIDAGVLCLLHGGLRITHSVDLKVEKAFALSASREFIACACNNGVVKLYTIDSLEYAGGLQYNEDKQNNVTSDTDHQSKVSQDEIQLSRSFPDAIACQFSTSEKLVVVYRDHSLYIWNIHGKFKATKCCVLVSHSADIWDIKNLSCENMHDPSLACVARGCTGGVSFTTCSADGSIRLWDLALQSASTENRSTFHRDQHHVVTEPLNTSCLVSAGIFERESVVSGAIPRGYRSMAVSSDGKHLAAGDSDGNLHIYDLYTSEYTCIQDAHDAEILSLSFSLPVKNIGSAEDLESYYLLASGGRDRMIHLFDVNRNFDLIASVDDHSAAVTSVKLSGNGRKILSCSSDRSLIFRDVAGTGTDYTISSSHHQKASHGSVHDMAVDPLTEIAVTVGQDKKINTFNIVDGQVVRSFKQDGDFGDPIKVALDPSCSYVACSYSNRSICMFDFTSGEMVARAMGHGEVVNGIIFLPDCKHLVSVGSDGCIFVWKLPTSLMLKMLRRIKENSCPLSPSTIAQPVAVSQIRFCERDNFRSQLQMKLNDTALFREGKCPQDTSTFKFSVSRLPQWAKSKVTSPLVIRLDPLSCEVGRQQLSPIVSGDGGTSPVHLTLSTPSNHSTENSRKKFPRRLSGSSSDTSNNKDSSTTQGNCRSFALDKRWLTIHTVCLDPSNSPEVCGLKKQMTMSSNLCCAAPDPTSDATDMEPLTILSSNPSVTNSSLPEDLVVGHGACPNKHIDIGSNNFGSLCNSIGQHWVKDAHSLADEVADESSEQLEPCTSANQVVDECIVDIGNKSANSEPQARNSSRRKSYSARFVVRRDLVRGQKLVLDSPIIDRGESQSQQEGSEWESQSQQVTKWSTPNPSTPSSSSGKSTKVNEATKVKNHQHTHNDIEKQDMLNACREALRALNASAKTALDIFSTLRNVTSEAELYAEAAEMLPKIAENMHEIAKMAARFSGSCEEDKGDIFPGFEPLLGKFDESLLSQRIMDM